MPRFLSAALVASITLTATAFAQVRVTPEKSKGGTKWGEPWDGIPETFRNLGVPDWKPPTDLKQWEATGREGVRKILRDCLGDMPARPDPKKVKVLSREE